MCTASKISIPFLSFFFCFFVAESEKTESQRVEEQRIFQELMEVVEQRDALVALLDEDRKK